MVRLRVFDSVGQEVREVAVPEDGLWVGRGDDAGLCLPEKAVSRRHARLYFHENELVVEDEGSANGVWVEGVKTDGPTIVDIGQRMRIGTFTIVVERAEEPSGPVDSRAKVGDSFDVPPGPPTTPRGPPEPYEVQLIGRDGPFKGERYVLKGDETTVGRVPGNDIVLDDASISRRHAKIVRSGSTYTLFDLRSSNGTRVGGVKVSRHDLEDGDALQFGDIPMVFSSSARSGSDLVPGAPRSRARRLRLAILVSALVVLASVVVVGILLQEPPPTPPPSAEELLEERRLAVRAELDRGNEALRVGDLVGAENAFRAALQRDPINAEANAGLARLGAERSNRESFERAEGLFQTRRELDRARVLYEAIPESSTFHARAQDRLREIRRATAEEERDQGLGACRVRSWRDCQRRLCRFFQLWPHDEPPPDGDTIRQEIQRAEGQLRRNLDFVACELPETASGETQASLDGALTERYPDTTIRSAVLAYGRADLVGATTILRRLEKTRSFRDRLPEIERIRSKLDIVEAQAADVYRQIQAGDLEATAASFRTLVDSDNAILPEEVPHQYREEVARQIGDAFFEKGAEAQNTGDFRATFGWWTRGKSIAPQSTRLVRGLFELRQRAAQSCASGTAAAAQGEVTRARADFELCRDISEPDTDVHRQALRELTQLE
ncbi:MAG: FHA domain-containing protein [Deltaproteobacteria bacterium]|nr:FHA domain-containing protein [Deltaproteobacteria bacterium]